MQHKGVDQGTGDLGLEKGWPRQLDGNRRRGGFGMPHVRGGLLVGPLPPPPFAVGPSADSARGGVVCL